MTPERRGDSGLRKRLDDIQHGYERWTRHTIELLGILVIIQLFFGVLSVYLVGENAKRGDEVRQLVRAQQDSRESAIRTTCQEQNAHHDGTLATIDQVIAKMPPGTQRDRAEQSRAATKLVIDSLAPKRDCEKRVRELTRQPQPQDR